MQPDGAIDLYDFAREYAQPFWEVAPDFHPELMDWCRRVLAGPFKAAALAGDAREVAHLAGEVSTLIRLDLLSGASVASLRKEAFS
jgi:hypothetical protein